MYKTEIKRGDIYYADLRTHVGHEQSGIRPVLILQDNSLKTLYPTVIIAPITSREKDSETHIFVRKVQSGLKDDSYIVLEQIKSIDISRLREKIWSMPSDIMAKVDEKLYICLGIQKSKKEGQTVTNELRIFNNPKFGKIRTVETEEGTKFIATDIAKALGYVNPHKAISDHCRWVTKREVPHPQSPDKTIEVNVIPKGDIYRLAANSELPGAREFESWIFDEVIPSIDETGGYIPKSEDDTDEDILAKAVLIAQKTIEKKNQIIAEKDMQINALKPAAEFGNAVGNSRASILVRDYVKVLSKDGIKIGQDEFFEWLYKKGYIYRTKEKRPQWVAYSTYTKMGILHMVERPFSTAEHGDIIKYTVKITGKGQMYFYEKLKAAGL